MNTGRKLSVFFYVFGEEILIKSDNPVQKDYNNVGFAEQYA